MLNYPEHNICFALIIFSLMGLIPHRHFSYQLSVISYQYLCLFAQHSAGKSEA
ncbi:MAG: hypothetical protein F6K17_02255 [Okeania sp. SIO3C4]|nr:hypothetical protein [Okeania sp. SIO3B3]NER01535.1 hypothetical protein [Okeania sp. SIO3C4]